MKIVDEFYDAPELKIGDVVKFHPECELDFYGWGKVVKHVFKSMWIVQFESRQMVVYDFEVIKE